MDQKFKDIFDNAGFILDTKDKTEHREEYFYHHEQNDRIKLVIIYKCDENYFNMILKFPEELPEASTIRHIEPTIEFLETALIKELANKFISSPEHIFEAKCIIGKIVDHK